MSEYADRDTKGLGAYYARHVSAMTGEALQGKAEIAAELAHRDREIDSLRTRLQRAEGLLKFAKCPDCDGNGIVAHSLDEDGQPVFGPCQWCDERNASLGERNG